MEGDSPKSGRFAPLASHFFGSRRYSSSILSQGIAIWLKSYSRFWIRICRLVICSSGEVQSVSHLWFFRHVRKQAGSYRLEWEPCTGHENAEDVAKVGGCHHLSRRSLASAGCGSLKLVHTLMYLMVFPCVTRPVVTQSTMMSNSFSVRITMAGQSARITSNLLQFKTYHQRHPSRLQSQNRQRYRRRRVGARCNR